jgi:hypothetical protein
LAAFISSAAKSSFRAAGILRAQPFGNGQAEEFFESGNSAPIPRYGGDIVCRLDARNRNAGLPVIQSAESRRRTHGSNRRKRTVAFVKIQQGVQVHVPNAVAVGNHESLPAQFV